MANCVSEFITVVVRGPLAEIDGLGYICHFRRRVVPSSAKQPDGEFVLQQVTPANECKGQKITPSNVDLVRIAGRVVGDDDVRGRRWKRAQQEQSRSNK